MTADKSWLPNDSSSGRGAQRDMLLGPFFSVSGLMEDSAEVKRHYMSGEVDHQSLATMLQQRLSICRVRGNNHIMIVIEKNLYLLAA